MSTTEAPSPVVCQQHAGIHTMTADCARPVWAWLRPEGSDE